MLVLDEVQKLPNWTEEIKRLWDEDTRDVREHSRGKRRDSLHEEDLSATRSSKELQVGIRIDPELILPDGIFGSYFTDDSVVAVDDRWIDPGIDREGPA